MCLRLGDDHRWPSAENRPCRSDGWSPEIPGSHSSFQLLPGTHVNHLGFPSSTLSITTVSLQPACIVKDTAPDHAAPKLKICVKPDIYWWTAGCQAGSSSLAFGARWWHSLKNKKDSHIIWHQISANSRWSFCYLPWDIVMPGFTQFSVSTNGDLSRKEKDGFCGRAGILAKKERRKNEKQNR